MKKYIALLLTITLTLTLTACGNDTYKVGATAVPHAEILEQVQPILEEQGYEFEIEVFDDYVLPNTALESGDLIANFFQHVPYLELQIEENGFEFSNAGGVHVEPIGLYSKEYASVAELPTDLELVISNSPSDRPRLLGVLEENNIITLNDNVTNADIVNASLSSLSDLFTSDKNITFLEVDAALLYTNYDNESGDAVLINGNYALDNGLNPLEDALVLEGSASLYVNILVCRTENLEDPFIQALVEALQSDTIQQWIEDNYGGAVVPAA